LIGLILLIAN